MLIAANAWQAFYDCTIGYNLAYSNAVPFSMYPLNCWSTFQKLLLVNWPIYICALAGLATWPLGWRVPAWPELAALVAVGLCGGIAHLLLTESYRWAPASLVAPFDYTSMVWAFMLGYLFFNELPGAPVFAGAAIIAAAGLFVIWRERQLGLQRLRGAEGRPTGG